MDLCFLTIKEYCVMRQTKPSIELFAHGEHSFSLFYLLVFHCTHKSNKKILPHILDGLSSMEIEEKNRASTHFSCSFSFNVHQENQ